MAAGIVKLAQIKPDGDAIYMSFAGSNPVRFLKQFDVGPYIALLIIEQALKATGGNTDDDPDSSKPCTRSASPTARPSTRLTNTERPFSTFTS